MSRTLIAAGLGVALCAGSALGAFRGGAVLTNDAWNAAASAAIGQTVTVTRHYALFDEADDTALVAALDRHTSEAYSFVRTIGGHSLYQHEFGGDTVNSVSQASIDLLPDIEWDSFLTLGPTIRSEVFTNFLHGGGPVEFTDDGIQLAPDGLDNAGWLLAPVGIDPPPPGGGSLYAGTAGMGHNVFDEATGLYGVAIAQMTVLGAHDEFTSFSEAGADTDIFASRLFRGGAWVHWNDFLFESSTKEELIYSVPAPAAGLLFGLGFASTRRRRR